MIVTATVTLRNAAGMHARPAAELARLAASLDSTVVLQTGEKTINAASVLALLASGVQQGDELIVRCDGEMADRDLPIVLQAIESGLGDRLT